jgi:uncharacterized membrane protein
MMLRRIRSLALAGAVVLAGLVMAAPTALAQDGEQPVVRGVLFFSPTCGHCEYVINSVLPPLYAENGGPWEIYLDEPSQEEGGAFYLLDNGTLQFLLVDVTVEAGSILFQEATNRYDIDSGGVPRMIVDDEAYTGSADIPEALPELIATGLGNDGIDWPTLAGVGAAVASIPVPAATTATSGAATTTTEAGGVLPSSGDDSVADRFGRDSVGNAFSVIVLVGMLTSLWGVSLVWRRPGKGRRLSIAVPIVALFGIAVAAYLSYVETSGAEAVCGPVGDCNTVQQSQYAELFGVIPIGTLGLIGYAAVLAAWVVARTDGTQLSDVAKVALFGGTVVGVAFSVYLTFLEPFVIGATCAWCLTSALVITALMWLAAGPAADSWSELRVRPWPPGSNKALSEGPMPR